VEQDLRIDPLTGFRLSDPRNNDAKQNLNYVRHTDRRETSRDYSRPHTIPREEYEAATGRNHDEAIREYEHNQESAAEEAAKHAHHAPGY